MLELFRLRQVEPAEERPMVHADRLLQIVARKRCREVPEIAGQQFGVQPKVVAGAEHRVLTQGRAEEVKRGAKLVSGFSRAALGPEKGKQLVAAQGSRVLDGQQGKERNALPQGGPTCDRAVRTVQRSTAKQPKREHPNDLEGRTRA